MCAIKVIAARVPGHVIIDYEFVLSKKGKGSPQIIATRDGRTDGQL
jgi:hypothetical protein